jgi:hypothetical protein
MNDEAPAALPPTASPETIGQASAKIPVELSTRFLEHFSEQLYSSPQKAFEELISNGWDAGADCVDVRISADLKDANATMSVLDNGSSMDEEGLRQLWHIAFSPKKDRPFQYGRHIIGKFGIGKLATYVLASKLTYICRAADGKIRRVTMDYSEIDRQKGASQDRLISELNLDLYEVAEEEVAEALAAVYDGAALLDSIKNGVPRPKGELGDDEFGAPKADLQRPPSGTWTLVVLSGLKSTGRELKIGILRRMLEAALPFGSEMAISVNGELLASSKVDAPVMREWVLGPDLGIDSIQTDDGDIVPTKPAVPADAKEAGDPKPTRIPVKSGAAPVPHVELPGIGRVTGRVRLFENRISGGKSEERGASNGFHVNVLGRVVNQSDASFGEENLSHAAWARFRMTVRADGLNEFLTTDREKFRERRELKVFRAFLRSVFNAARNYYDSDRNAEMPDGGDVLVQSLGVLSLNPLRNVVSDALATQSPIPGLFDETGIKNRDEKRRSWRENTADNIKSALGQVKYERIKDGSFAKFRIADNTILVNKDHPFVAEHSRTRAEKELLRTIAMVNLLSDVYALDIGVQPAALESMREYRDRLMRFRALQRRQSGTYIAKLLLQMQHDSGNSRRLEAVLSDALRYLGFQVKDLATSGEPEGIASAYPMPTFSNPTCENPTPPLYSFSFDAKSSKHETAATGNIKLDGVVEHRERYRADHALVVAPGFSDGALATRCAQQRVTPMAARDLGKLLEYTVEYGAIPVTKIREVFHLHSPNAVSEWVEKLEGWLREKRPLTIDVFLKALENLKGKVPDVLPAGTIALECRQGLQAYSVKDEDVIAIAKGLSILVPDLVGIDGGDKIVVNASATRVAAAVESQLERLHDERPVATVDTGGGEQ